MVPINDDCLKAVYRLIDEPSDQRAFSLVSKQFYAIWRDSLDVREKLFHLELNRTIPANSLLNRVRFWVCGIDLDQNRLDLDSPYIETVSLNTRFCKEEFFLYLLRKCSKLKSLTLVNSIVHPALISGLDRLRALQLPDCGLYDCDLLDLGKMTRLEHLNLTDNFLSDDGIDCLRGLTRLKKLSLSLCDKISDEGGETIAAFSSLQELRLDFCSSITPLFFRKIHALPLETLSIKECKEMGRRGGIASLVEIRTIKHLDMSLVPIPFDLFQGLTHLEQLESLSIEGVGAEKDHCVAVRQFSRLTRLSIGFNPLDFASIKILTNCPALKELSLNGTEQLHGIAVRFLIKNAGRLESLDIRHCYRVNEVFLEAIGSLKSLKVTCAGHSLLRESDIQAARRFYPHVHIEMEEPGFHEAVWV